MPLQVLSSAKLSESQFNEISYLVRDLCGIDLREGKMELVKARLAKRLRQLNLRNYAEYIGYVKKDKSGAELAAMLDAISTNLTSFFRESEHFVYLAAKVLGQSVANAAEGKRRIRIWSAGCSSGEEPYSIAITVAQNIPNLSSWDARILATDISTSMLAKAKQGVYDPNRLKGIGGQLRSSYFSCIQTRPERLYRINDAVRALVHFARMNLMEPWPIQGLFDAIFCRNVMIYFDKPTRAKLVERFCDLLIPGGTLFIGHSESLTGVSQRLRYAQPAVYEKH